MADGRRHQPHTTSQQTISYFQDSDVCWRAASQSLLPASTDSLSRNTQGEVPRRRPFLDRRKKSLAGKGDSLPRASASSVVAIGS